VAQYRDLSEPHQAPDGLAERVSTALGLGTPCHPGYCLPLLLFSCVCVRIKSNDILFNFPLSNSMILNVNQLLQFRFLRNQEM
jgi:hypothetical protein